MFNSGYFPYRILMAISLPALLTFCAKRELTVASELIVLSFLNNHLIINFIDSPLFFILWLFQKLVFYPSFLQEIV